VILAMAAPEQERVFRLGWSLWRRAHQAMARRCHMASRALLQEKPSEKESEPSSVPVVSTTSTLHRASAKLADEQWARLKPLLPENGHRGGQWREHRTVVEAILWVLVNGASWRDLPKEFGPWQTAYQRYIRWQHEGLWQVIVEMLRC
jgi:Putative transposase of IS4/5 family (DUF4096)